MRRLDKRRLLIPAAILVTFLGGALISISDTDTRTNITAVPSGNDQQVSRGETDAQRAHERFQQAVAMLQAGHHDYAVAALTEVLAIHPSLPEAHVNMGYALLGLGDTSAAAGYFERASDLRPSLHNAYYGLALAERGNGNDTAALAAMQAYAHIADPDDRHLPRAQAFIWELQATLEEESP